MQKMYSRLSEKNKCLYAGVEALKFFMVVLALLLNYFLTLKIPFGEELLTQKR
jgi:hypothetical protein